MAERLSQLQDTVNIQADNFCNAIGCLQQFATPSFFPEFEKSSQSSSSGGRSSQLNNGQQNGSEDHAQTFARIIAQTAKEIDLLIDSLPSEESSPELQASHLRKLEGEKQEAAQKLEESVKRGEKLLEQIQEALQDIAQAQLKLQCISDSSNPNIEQNPLDSTLSSSGHHSTTGHHPSGTSS